MCEAIDTVEHFFGVYLLYCTNPRYKGRTYIGYTTDPNRRIKQHNDGKQAGGAWRTSNKGPWVMVMIVHGFPNDIAALRFEWAWQHPHVSRRLRHVGKRRAREPGYDYCLRVLSEMLNVGPWRRLPLVVRWLNDDFARPFPVSKTPPIHIPICHGPVISKKLPSQAQKPTPGSGAPPSTTGICSLCFDDVADKRAVCLNGGCDLSCHITCLADLSREKKEFIPVDVECPSCRGTILWGDVVRKLKGCYDSSDLAVDVNQVNDFYSSDSD